MTTTTQSRWLTGTYELLMMEDDTNQDILIVSIFAKASDPEDVEADEDAPLLYQEDFSWQEILADLPAAFELGGLRDIGENGITPEDMEATYGPALAVRLMLGLFRAAERDFRGVDIDLIPWRLGSSGAFAIMERTHDCMAVLGEKILDISGKKARGEI